MVGIRYTKSFKMIVAITIIGVFASLAQAVIPPNNEPTFYVFKHDKIYYYIPSNYEGNFISSMEFCEKHDMKLLVIDSSAQDQAVYDAIIKLVGKESPRLWTSGSRRSSNGAGDWIWMTTGNKLGFTNWGTGQPSSSGVGAAQQCIQLLPNYFSKGYWDDCECYELRTPVCMSTDH